MSARLKVLCLHGFTSNGAVHAHQLRRLTSALPQYEFLFPDGPHKVDIATQLDLSKPENKSWSEYIDSHSTSGHRAWWFARDGNWQNREGGFFGLETSLDFLGKYMAEHSPVHSIWGFSQGACFAAMLCTLLQQTQSEHPLRKLMPEDLKTPRAGIIFSGFKARFPQYDSVYENGVNVPLLHAIGENDPMVSSKRSQDLIQICKDPKVLKHDGGHNIPKSDDDTAIIVQFAQKYIQDEQKT